MELRIEKMKENKKIEVNKEMFKEIQSNMVVANFNSFYSLLIVVPEVTECYETMHILKYFDFPINIEEDNIMKPAVKKEMGFRPDDEVIYF